MDNNKRKHEWNVIVKLGQRDRPTDHRMAAVIKESFLLRLNGSLFPSFPSTESRRQTRTFWCARVQEMGQPRWRPPTYIVRPRWDRLRICLSGRWKDAFNFVVMNVQWGEWLCYASSLSPFDRRGERRMHFDGAEFVVRNSGHSAGFDSNNLLRVYW